MIHDETLPQAGTLGCPSLLTLLAAAAAPDEDAGIAAHLDGCARCRAIALGAREVASELPPERADVGCDRVEALCAEADDGAALAPGDQARLLVHFVGCDTCRGSVEPLDPPDTSDPSTLAAPAPSSLPVVARSTYIFEEELARGGMGRISRAVDRRLGRTIAVKEVIPDGQRPYAEARAWNARLEREARITARLNHPSIVSVHEAGIWPRGTPFFAMDLVAGRSLDRVIAEAGTLRARLALLPHVIAAADALAYAHSEDIVHRDLKPANILVGRYGETVVIDWGLAKDLRAPSTDEPATTPAAGPLLTQAGTALGTPSYMPPEQAGGEVVGRAADVYALGAMLYHLLAGRPPYAGLAASELLAAVRTRGPTPLVELVPQVPRALATIVARAMERDPGARYPSAAELADELRRFQTGQLVRAHDYAALERVRHWLAHRRVSVTLAVGLAAALLATGVAGIGGIVGERDRATAAAERAERISERLTLARARSLIARDPTAAAAWLRRVKITAENWLEVQTVAAEAEAAGVATAVLDGHLEEIHDVRTSTDGRTVVSADAGGEIRVWDLVAGSVHVLGDDGASIGELALSPDGRTLAVASDRGLSVWDLVTGTRRELPGHRGPVHTVGYAPGGRELVTGGADGTARRWSVETGNGRVIFGVEATGTVRGLEELSRTPDDAGHVLTFHAASDVTLVFTAAGEIVAVDAGGVARWRAEHPGGMPSSYALAPAGDEIVTRGQDGALRRWRITTGEVVTLPRGEDVVRIEISPDGRWLAASTRGPLVRLWDLRDGGTHDLPGHTLNTYRVAFSRDSCTYASAGHDGTARVWAPERGEVWTLRGHRSAVKWLAFGAGGTLLSLATDGTARLWHPRARGTRTLPVHGGPIYRVRAAAAALAAVTVSLDGTLRVWDLATLEYRVHDHGTGVRNAWLSPDGRAALGTDATYGCRLWDGAAAHVVGGRGACAQGAAFSPDGVWLATLDREGKLRTWRRADPSAPALTVDEVSAVAFAAGGELRYLTRAGAIVRRAPGGGAPEELGHTPGPVVSGGWSLDGDRVVAGADGHFTVVEVPGGRQARMRVPDGVSATGLAPDGRLLAAGDLRGRLHVLDTTAGTVRVLAGHTRRVIAIALSRNARWAASASEGELLLWDLATGRHRRLLGHPEWVNDLAFSSDDEQLMSVGTDGSIRLWSAELASPLPASPADLAAELARVTRAVLGEDDELVPASPTPR